MLLAADSSLWKDIAVCFRTGGGNKNGLKEIVKMSVAYRRSQECGYKLRETQTEEGVSLDRWSTYCWLGALSMPSESLGSRTEYLEKVLEFA